MLGIEKIAFCTLNDRQFLTAKQQLLPQINEMDMSISGIEFCTLIIDFQLA